MTVPRSIANVRAYYLIANEMDALCWEHRDLLEDFPLFVEYAGIRRRNALQIYQDDPETIRSQACNVFDCRMLREPDRYAGLPEESLSPEREAELLQAIADRETKLRKDKESFHQKETDLQTALDERDAQLSRTERTYRQQLCQKDATIQKANAALDAVYESASWKVGNRLIQPLHWLKALLSK